MKNETLTSWKNAFFAILKKDHESLRIRGPFYLRLLLIARHGEPHNQMLFVGTDLADFGDYLPYLTTEYSSFLLFFCAAYAGCSFNRLFIESPFFPRIGSSIRCFR